MTTETIPQTPITDEELDRLFGGALLVEEDIIQRDHRTCDCPLTYVHRKRHAALGTAIEIRLCCLAQFIEKQFDLPAGTFFKSIDFEPSWEWDCNKPVSYLKPGPAGKRVMVHTTLGPPPAWLKKRMLKKGVKILNLPSE